MPKNNLYHSMTSSKKVRFIFLADGGVVKVPSLIPKNFFPKKL